MSEQKHNNKKTSAKQLFFDNPYDVETFFEGMTIAKNHGMELQYIDRLVAYIRLDPTGELTTLVYSCLRDLKIITME
jgi:hypothetical protein